MAPLNRSWSDVTKWALTPGLAAALLFGSQAVGQEITPVAPIADVQMEAPAPRAAAGPRMMSDAEVKEIVKAALKEDADKKKKADEDKKKAEEGKKEAEGYVVGSDYKLGGSWDPTGGLNFTSANGDFRVKIRTGLQYDAGWFRAPNKFNSTTAVPGAGYNQGTGPLDDGAFIRRARIRMDGTIYEQFEFATEFDFENLSDIRYDDMWIGMQNLPFLGTIRVGQYKVPQSLEQYTSWWNQPLMERSGNFETFNQDLNPEIFQSNNWFDQRLVFSQALHRITAFNQFNGAAFGDGTYAYTGRLTALPIWQDEGRVFMHLGASYQYRSADLARNSSAAGALATSPTALTNKSQYVVRFRDRNDIRDGVGGDNVENGTGAVGVQGNQTRLIDTGVIVADHVQTVNTEAAFIYGPLELSGEAEFTYVNNAISPASAAGTRQGMLYFFGSYWQAGYFLTGESRDYDKRFGRFARQHVNSNFFWTRNEDGRLCNGLGAIELVYRGSYIDLNSKAVRGGQLLQHTFGAQWLLNPFMKVMANYNIANRDVINPAAGGVIQAVGVQAQLEF